MKRQRPPMPPLSVRVQVAERQFFSKLPNGVDSHAWYSHDRTLKQRLHWLLQKLFPLVDNEKKTIETKPCALDHDPALILRPYNPRIKNVAARYTPHAHDPDALVYREKADHQQKTTGRKPGAAKTVTTKGSDIWLKSKFNRLEGRTKQRPKQKIPGRPFPKGRKFDARR